MQAKRFLAFDLGAESGRAMVVHFDGKKMLLEELHRFNNAPVRVQNTLHWDALNIYKEIRTGLSAYVSKYGSELEGISCDSWGVDYGLLDKHGRLISNPVHYRDSRTNGIPEKLFNKVSRKEIFNRTGIQIMQINTLFQLFAESKYEHSFLDQAETMLWMADLQHYFLSGEKAQEYTLATTSQMIAHQTGDWDRTLIKQCGIPDSMLPEIVAPGSVIGVLTESLSKELGLRQVPIIASACHDTAAAVAAVPAKGDDWLFLSSGTWSLLGAELTSPQVNEKTFQMNFTNEGGVDGTIRFLKNIMGLWLVQECRREWERNGEPLTYTQIVDLANAAAPLVSYVDPNDESFLAPGDMPNRICDFCKRTRQPIPETKGAIIRCALESLALEYRRSIDFIENVTGKSFSTLHIVGGGSQNKLLNQFASDATGKVVITSPVEATAYGNGLMQAIALGILGSLSEAREVVRSSVEVAAYTPTENRNKWDDAYKTFLELSKR